MTKKKSEKPTDLERLHEWIAAVDGSIALGTSILKDVELSKSGDKLTIILKKEKPKLSKKAAKAEEAAKA